MINLMLGEIFLEWNHLDEAEQQIREGLRLLEDWPIPQVRSLGWGLLTRLSIARNDLESANTTFEQIRAAPIARFHPLFLDAVERTRVQLFIAGHETTALETWLLENELKYQQMLQEPIHFRHEARLLAICRAWLALGRSEMAAKLLERLAEGAQERSGSRAAILVLLAASALEPARAMAALEEALQLAEPEGYLRTFIDAGEPLRQVLKMWLKQPVGVVDSAANDPAQTNPRIREYARQILSAWEKSYAPAHPDLARQSLASLPQAQSLSPREQEVLQQMAQGLTNQQIAERLVISVRTVKKHVENIHGKLNVQNRTQAAARARELGLLE